MSQIDCCTSSETVAANCRKRRINAYYANQWMTRQGVSSLSHYHASNNVPLYTSPRDRYGVREPKVYTPADFGGLPFVDCDKGQCLPLQQTEPPQYVQML